MNVDKLSKITIILRGYTYEETRTIVEVLSRSKINSVEITLNTEGSKEIIKKIIAEYGDRMLIGAGTVVTKQDLLDVIKIGAKFVLSPVIWDKEMFDICKENNVISIPGTFTPSEIYESFQLGADIVKVFPAGIVTPKFFKDIMAPLGHLRLMAVGGVNEKNIAEFFANGVEYAGIGSGIFNKEDVTNKNYEKMAENVRALEIAAGL
jgi:2-dehydro-3-deoxyphosphogluconate aldolase/(4S)-4-hydroxy-2-oxoglutarate aldolase